MTGRLLLCVLTLGNLAGCSLDDRPRDAQSSSSATGPDQGITGIFTDGGRSQRVQADASPLDTAAPDAGTTSVGLGTGQTKAAADASEPVMLEDAGEAAHDAGRQPPMAATDAGIDAATEPSPDAARDAGPASTMGAAGSGGSAATSDQSAWVDTLVELASRTPQGANAQVILRFISELNSADAGQSLVQTTTDFLMSIDEEEHCSERFSQECVAACGLVAQRCALCVLDASCRTQLVSVCGTPAAICRRR